MIDNEIRAHLENVVKPINAIDVDKAIEAAINALVNLSGEKNNRAAMTLLMIYDQHGCDHLDCGHHPERPGQLTDAISVIVFG